MFDDRIYAIDVLELHRPKKKIYVHWIKHWGKWFFLTLFEVKEKKNGFFSEHDKPRWLLMRYMKKVNNGREMVFKIAFQFLYDFYFGSFLWASSCNFHVSFVVVVILKSLTSNCYNSIKMQCLIFCTWHWDFEKQSFNMLKAIKDIFKGSNHTYHCGHTKSTFEKILTQKIQK